jgi:uncharacterized lipoprotein YddW (UPF0748 family)
LQSALRSRHEWRAGGLRWLAGKGAHTALDVIRSYLFQRKSVSIRVHPWFNKAVRSIDTKSGTSPFCGDKPNPI